MVTIPGKQLIIQGTRSALESNLLEREIGFCLDDSLCYVKYNGSLHLLGGALREVFYETSTFSDVVDALQKYNMLFVRVSIEGEQALLLSSSSGDNRVLFSGTVLSGGSLKYYSAEVTPSGWSDVHETPIFTDAMTEDELSEIVSLLE